MKLRHSCHSALALVVLAALLITGCASRPEEAPQPTVLPTAQVRAASPTPAAVAPTSIPPFATPRATAAPTARPLPPTPTTQPVGPDGAAFPLKTERLEFGAQTHLFYTNRYTPLVRARDGGFGWVRQQIHWKDQEGPAGNYAWGELNDIVASVHSADLKLLISIVQAPSFYTADGGHGLPANPKNLGDFVEALATQYKGRVHAIQIWNEQNLAYENGGKVSVKDAGQYVEILKEAYIRIKAVDPSIIVVSGAPASTATNAPGVAVDDLSYYKAMFAYQNSIIRNYVDAVGVHPGGSANPPDSLWPDQPSAAEGWTDHRTFYFRRIEDYHKLMAEYGLDKHQMWITEFGWATSNNTPGYEFGNQISYEQQADYIVRAMQRTKEQYPWVGAMFLWNLNFAPLWAQNGNVYHEQASFSILNGDYSPRPAYWAIQQFIGQVRAEESLVSRQ
jgi:GH35 family endo-1,4-beta-xylanase